MAHEEVPATATAVGQHPGGCGNEQNASPLPLSGKHWQVVLHFKGVEV